MPENPPGSDRAPPHMPHPFMPSDAYDRLYVANHGVEGFDYSGTDEQVICISDGLSAEDVYRTLPSAPDFEYAGYLMNTEILYSKYWATSSTGVASMPCTFHSHPTKPTLGDPDIPSYLDVYGFLKWRHRRAITIGKDLIWVMDKTPQTVPIIEDLYCWEADHMLSEMKRHFTQQGPQRGRQSYIMSVLCVLGLGSPTTLHDFKECWPELLQGKLKIKVTIYQR